MWALVERYTGQVGYKGGTKASGLDADLPVIDCSGWTALLLSTGMAAANRQAGRSLFNDADVAAVHTWSDRQSRTWNGAPASSSWATRSPLRSCRSMPPLACSRAEVLGLRTTHALVESRMSFKSSIAPGTRPRMCRRAQGMTRPYVLRLLPLAEWIERTRDYLKPDMAWAVKPVRVAKVLNYAPVRRLGGAVSCRPLVALVKRWHNHGARSPDDRPAHGLCYIYLGLHSAQWRGDHRHSEIRRSHLSSRQSLRHCTVGLDSGLHARCDQRTFPLNETAAANPARVRCKNLEFCTSAHHSKT